MSMIGRMRRCWATEIDLRGRPHLPRQVTMLRSLRGALDDVLGFCPPPWGDGTLLVCHGGHLVDVLHAPQRQGSLGDEYSPLTSAALLEGGRVPSMTREYKFKSC